jgi:hypothetical protein
MARTGDLLDGFDDLFADTFGDPLVVRNFTEGARDDYGDTAKTLDSEVETLAQIERPDDPQEVSRASGQTTTTDVEILLSADVDVSDGSDERPYPSELSPDGFATTYTAVAVFDERNGAQRVDAVSAEQS